MLFQYVNGDGNPQAITSADVNAYIRDATGGDFTAKHFRTWGASVIFFKQMLAKAEEKRLSIKTALEPVAEALGNTPAISRKSYVHPAPDRGAPAGSRATRSTASFPPPPRRRLSSRRNGLPAFLKKMTPRRGARRRLEPCRLPRHKRGHDKPRSRRHRPARNWKHLRLADRPISTGWRWARWSPRPLSA